MKLCIAEKPSVARDIAKVLGATTPKNGYMEGNGYWVTWTFGHLCTLKEPHDYAPEYKAWNLFLLPIIPKNFGIKLINNNGVERQFKVIESLVKDCDEVINCGDAGQEGELIQRWVLQKAKCDKPVKRLWISSLTEDAIKEGFENLKSAEDYKNLYLAGNARAIGDWLLGINATRLFTKKFGGNKAVLSIGRVQTPTLAMLVKRQKEIDAFVQEDYWELKTKYREVVFSAAIDRLKSLDRAEKGLDYLQQNFFEIVSFEINGSYLSFYQSIRNFTFRIKNRNKTFRYQIIHQFLFSTQIRSWRNFGRNYRVVICYFSIIKNRFRFWNWRF